LCKVSAILTCNKADCDHQCKHTASECQPKAMLTLTAVEHVS